ncbi:hypothetical protein ACIA5D_33460 [Actinoplanes sp. NPDC051513]|uniref:hypothetical protein n=1 Tax=Actinoplanes sp. NPDC051513 TaxID=3363908 RepID=UPI0037A765DD
MAVNDHRREDSLADRQVVALVLRIVLDRRGVVLQGEVVDAATRDGQRFAGWEELVATIRRCLGQAADR